MNRTQNEIVSKIKEIKVGDFFGFKTQDLVGYLDFEHAKEFLKEGVKAEQWTLATKSPAEQIAEYMPFAWDKANNCRGLSAGRSVNHMEAWTWLDGKDDLSDGLEDIYEYYGKPCLVAVCNEYGIDWRALDDNRWRNDEDGEYKSADDALCGSGLEHLLNARQPAPKEEV